MLFGTSIIAARFGVQQFHPFSFVGLRLFLAFLVHLTLYTPIVGRYSRTFPRDVQLWRHAAVLGVFATAIPITLIVSALRYLSSGVTSILIAMNPAVTIVIAHYLLPDERLTRKKISGAVLALAGVLYLAVQGESGLLEESNTGLGYLLVISAVLCSAAMVVYARRYMKDLDTFDVASVRISVATMIMFPISVFVVKLDLSAVNSRSYAALIYSALAGNVLGLLGQFSLVKRFGATATALTAYAIPAIAGLGGVLVLGETITSGLFFGMVLIALGVGLALGGNDWQGSLHS